MRIISLVLSNGQTAIMKIYNNAVTVDGQIEQYLATPGNNFTVVSFREIADTDIPPQQRPGNREFRDAIVDDGTRIVVDMAKARAMHVTRLAAKRSERLAALRDEWLAAQEDGDVGAETAAKARAAALRSLDLGAPANITTPDALAAWSPAWS